MRMTRTVVTADTRNVSRSSGSADRTGFQRPRALIPDKALTLAAQPDQRRDAPRALAVDSPTLAGAGRANPTSCAPAYAASNPRSRAPSAGPDPAHFLRSKSQRAAV